ncbi:hypothetical protein JOD16_001959 [Enterococcus xiangfangensis]|nr:hypothetical protein [Enterococcus xiangfangensis]
MKKRTKSIGILLLLNLIPLLFSHFLMRRKKA